jgi:integrase
VRSSLCDTADKRGRRIAELDLESATTTWQLPAERTKNGLPHIVPLAPLAAKLFREWWWPVINTTGHTSDF